MNRKFWIQFHLSIILFLHTTYIWATYVMLLNAHIKCFLVLPPLFYIVAYLQCYCEPSMKDSVVTLTLMMKILFCDVCFKCWFLMFQPLFEKRRKKSKLVPSTMAKVWITPETIVWFTLPPNYTIWFKLPSNVTCLFHFSMHSWSFKLKFYNIIAHTITHIRKINHNFLSLVW